MKALLLYAVLLFTLLLSSTGIYAQTNCDASVPSFTVNLVGSPGGVWTSTAIARQGNCCGTANPDRCIEFIVTLDSNAQGIKFDIVSGAIPGGALFYQINCGPMQQVGQPICLSGQGPHRLTFCKPGNNINVYSITSIVKPKASPPTVVSDGCTGGIFATGYVESSITWRAVPANITYDNYLSCKLGCDSVTVNYQPGAPAFVDYEVCGTPQGGCTNLVVCDTVRVQFVNTLDVDIQPKFPTICFGSVGATLTANPMGGLAPYSYTWNTGATTQSIVAATPGTYSVILDDGTSCPIAYDTVVVTAFPSPIEALAGSDAIICNSNVPFFIQLNGSVVAATGGTWSSAGSGTFSPHADSLNAKYFPSAAEISAGSVLLTLTTTGNGTCPPDTDQVNYQIGQSAVVNPGNPVTVCANNANISLNGSVTVGSTTGVWSTNGSGSFTQPVTSLVNTYIPSQADKNNGSVTLTLTSTNNGLCPPVSANLFVTITPAPIVNAGADHDVCANNPVINLNGSVSAGATTGTWVALNQSGSFSPGATILNPVYTPSATEIAAGTVTFVLTSSGNSGGTCLPVRDTVIITILPAPIVDAGSNRVFCSNNVSSVALNGSITGGASTGSWASTGTGTFSPNVTTLNPSYVPSQSDKLAGSTKLYLTSTGNSGGLCTAVKDSLIITFTPSPLVNAGNDTTVCANNAVVNLNGNITGGASTGIWSAAGGSFGNATSLNTTFTPSVSQINAGVPVQIILTSTGNTTGTCNAVSDTLYVNFSPRPIVNAGPDDTVCANNPVIYLSGSISGGASTGVWSTNGTGIFSNINLLNSTYTASATDTALGTVMFILTSTNNGGCIAVRDTVIYIISDAPVVDAGPDRSVCENNIGTIILNGSISMGASSGTWSSNGFGTISNPASLNTTYISHTSDSTRNTITFKLTSTGNTNGLCNAVIDSFMVTITPEPVVIAGSNQTLCSNNASNVILNGVVSGGANTGIWSTSGTGIFSPNNTTLNATYQPSAADLNSGAVSLKLISTGNTGGTCHADSSVISITFTPAPVVNAGSDTIRICASQSDVLLGGSVTFGASTGIWSTNGTGIFSPNNTTLNATYQPSAADILAGNLLLILTSTNNGNCIAVSDTMHLIISPLNVTSAGNNLNICTKQQSFILNGNVSGGTSTGIWTTNGAGSFVPGNTTLNAQYIIDPSDTLMPFLTFVLKSTNNGICLMDEDTMTVNFTSSDDATFNYASGTFCISDPNPATGTVPFIQSGGAGTFSVTPAGLSINANTGEINIATSAIGIYNIKFVTNGSCPDSSTVIINIINNTPDASFSYPDTVCKENLTLLPGFPMGASAGIFSATPVGLIFKNAINNQSNTGEIDLFNSIPGTYIITNIIPPSGSCAGDTSSDTVTVNPWVQLATDTTVKTICANDPVASLNVTFNVISPVMTGTWKTNGDGSFASATSPVTTYTAGPNDISGGFVQVRFVSSDPAGVCDADSVSILISITPAPVVNAGIDDTLCAIDPFIQLNGSVTMGATTGVWSTSGTGIFSPSNNILNTQYITSSTDKQNGFVELILTSTGNSNGTCLPVRDTVRYKLLLDPVVNAGPDRTVCADKDTVQLQGSVTGSINTGVWSASGNGTFSPNATVLNAVYHLTAADTLAGSVTFILSSTGGPALCALVMDTLTLTITPAPNVNAGVNGNVCINNPNISLNGIINGGANTGQWISNGTGVFVPNDTVLNATYIPSGADINSGSVTFTLGSTNNGQCFTKTDLAQYLFTPSPVVEAGPDDTVCANGAAVNLNGSITAGASTGIWNSNGTGIFSPNNSVLNATYTLSQTDILNGSVKLFLTSVDNTNGTCLPVTDSLTISILPTVVINLTDTFTVCANNSTVVLNPAVTGTTNGIIWSTNGSGTFSPDNTTLNAMYIPSPSDTANGIVNLMLSIGNLNGCDPTLSNTVIIITPSPVVDAGPVSITVCANNDSVQLNGSVAAGANTGIWSSTGTGQFIPNNITLNAIYIPSLNDEQNGIVQLVLSSTGNTNNTCIAVSDTLILNITPSPVVNAGPTSITVCANNANISLNGSVSTGAITGVWQTTGDGQFTPNNTSLNAIYIPGINDIINGNVDLILISTGNTNNSCLPERDTVHVFITPSPVVNAGPNIAACISDNSIPLNAIISGGSSTGIWSSSGSGAFTPDNLSLNAVYIPSNADKLAGTVSLIITSTGNTSGTCIEVKDTVDIIFTPMIFADADDTLQVCANNGGVQLNGTISGGTTTGVWSTSGSGIFVPDNATLNAIYLPSIADTALGNVILTLTTTNNGGCDSVTAQTYVDITPAPYINAGPDLTTCNNTPAAAMAGVISGGATQGRWTTSGSGIFIPNDVTLNAIYEPGNSDYILGSVTLTLTSTDHGLLQCQPESDSMILTLLTSATVNAGPNQAICYEDTAAIVTAIATGVNPYKYYWSSGDTTQTVRLEPGIHYVRIQDANNCFPAYDTIQIFVFDTTILARAGQDTSICKVTDTIQLNGDVLATHQGRWTGGAGQFLPDDSTLNAVYVPTTSEKNQGFVELFLTPTGNYGCSIERDTIRINFIDKPSPQVNGPLLVCEEGDTVYYSTSYIPGNTYNWLINGGTIVSNNDTNFVRVLWSSSNGTLTVTEINPTGCDSVITAQIIYVAIPSPDINGELRACKSSQLRQTYSVIHTPGYTYSWDITGGNIVSGGNTSTVVVDWLSTGTLTVIENNGAGCTVSDLFNFEYDPVQLSTVSPLITDGCVPLTVQFQSNTQNPPSYFYKWLFNDGDTSLLKDPLHTYQTPGIYNASYIISNGVCSDTIYSLITVHDNPFAMFDFANTGNDTLIFPSDTLILDNQSPGNNNYEWTFGDGGSSVLENPVYEYNSSSGTYIVTLKVTDQQTGCIDIYTKRLVIIVESDLLIPNVFSPNGDGKNDYFHVYMKNLRSFRIYIYDRWGQMIYTSDDPEFHWDGTHKNTECMQGAYIYYIEALAETNEFIKKVGIVNIIK
jgi:gliding motility-associated-like protein